MHMFTTLAYCAEGCTLVLSFQLIDTGRPWVFLSLTTPIAHAWATEPLSLLYFWNALSDCIPIVKSTFHVYDSQCTVPISTGNNYNGALWSGHHLDPVLVASLLRCPFFWGYWYNVSVAYHYFQCCNVTYDLKVKHIKITSNTKRWYLAVLVLFLAFSSSCYWFDQWIYKYVAKVSTVRVSLYWQWYCWGHSKCLLCGITQWLHFRGSDCM